MPPFVRTQGGAHQYAAGPPQLAFLNVSSQELVQGSQVTYFILFVSTLITT